MTSVTKMRLAALLTAHVRILFCPMYHVDIDLDAVYVQSL